MGDGLGRIVRMGAGPVRPEGAARRLVHPRQPRLVGRPVGAEGRARARRSPARPSRRPAFRCWKTSRADREGRARLLDRRPGGSACLRPGKALEPQALRRAGRSRRQRLRRWTTDRRSSCWRTSPTFSRSAGRVSLTLSGHTMAGRSGCSAIRRSCRPRFGNRYAYGHVVEHDRHLIVSGGLGFSILPGAVRRPPGDTWPIDLGCQPATRLNRKPPDHHPSLRARPGLPSNSSTIPKAPP